MSSGTARAAPPTAVLGLGLELSGPWHQRAVQTSRALVQTYLLTGSVHPPPTAGGSRGTRTPLRLPLLVSTAKGPRRRSSMARLSLSEPSLLTPNETVPSEGLPSSCRPSVLQKRPPPPPPFSKSSALLPCKSCHPSRVSQPHQQQNHQPTFIHFSQAIQPSSKPRPARRHSQHSPVLTAEMAQGDLRPSVIHHRNSLPNGEPLFVVGKPCLPSCGHRPAVSVAAAGPARTQLHVFLPTEAEGEEVDSESVDEGFMDELDSKMTSLKLKQGGPKAVTEN
ncbi:hypothetical protein D5F01_LYC19704 [Larimichthys crocea]|uniref:Uncharacterized protein n=1 Tax=Larimichthys crocea TaxID=215358 RepID=A0A6G0HSZ0_LARCR|nr:hypothetical protein D5F01_LYC19704 [Larimichthys crocea]